MSASGHSAREAPSDSTWPSKESTAKAAFSGPEPHGNRLIGLGNKGNSHRESSVSDEFDARMVSRRWGRGSRRLGRNRPGRAGAPTRSAAIAPGQQHPRAEASRKPP